MESRQYVTIAIVAAALLGAQTAVAQGLAGTMAAIGIGSTMQGIGGLNSGAMRGRAQGVVANNNNYQNTLNGLMTDPNTASAQPLPPPPPPTEPAGTQNGGSNTGSTNTTGVPRYTRPVSGWGATGLAQLSSNPRNIMSVLGNFRGTNQLSASPRISLRVRTMSISSPTRSGTISTRGGTVGGTNQLGGGGGAGGGGQQQPGGAGGQQEPAVLPFVPPVQPTTRPAFPPSGPGVAPAVVDPISVID